MNDYPFPPLETRVNGKEVSILGVIHTRKFLEEHRTFLDKVINDHDTVVMEEAVVIRIPTYINFNYSSDEGFFREISTTAHQQSKRFFKVDPNNFKVNAFDIVTGVAALILGTTQAIKLKREIKGKIKKPRQITRRETLRSLGRIGAVGLCSPIFLGSWLSPLTWVYYGQGGILLYGSGDYRNLKIAEGIERICNEVDDLERIVSIHGAAHYKTVKTYLDNPSLRMKKLAYFPYELLGNTKIREFKRTEHGWHLAREF